MRKKIVESDAQSVTERANWLDLATIATVEVSSEHADFPVECVFVAGEQRGWRAAASGAQSIRLIFDQPTHIQHIQLRFSESKIERTQEFTLSYSADGSQGEIVRQQWSFSPQGSTSEVEDYTVNLSGVQTLELKLKPDLTPERAVATLESWRVG